MFGQNDTYQNIGDSHEDQLLEPIDDYELNLLDGIVNYADLEESSDELLMVSYAEFVVDFGPWKKGEKVDTLALHTWVKARNGTGPVLTSTSMDGKVGKSCRVQLIPAE